MEGPQITVFVLVASTTNRQKGYSAFRLPDGSIVAREAVISFLRSLQTPLICEGRRDDKYLAIDVRPVEEEQIQSHFAHADDQFAFFRTHITSAMKGRDVSESDRVVALTGPQGTLHTTVAEFHGW